MKHGIELESLVDDLRAQLTTLMHQAKRRGDDVRFEVEGVEVELKVVLQKTDKVGAKVKFWVVEAGGEGAVSEGVTQTVKLKLKPLPPEGSGPGPVAISRDDEPEV